MLKVLVVESTPWNLASAEAESRECFFDLTTCTTPQQAFEILRSGVKFDAVLTSLTFEHSAIAEGERYTESKPVPGGKIPSGLVVALAALDYGCPGVVIYPEGDEELGSTLGYLLAEYESKLYVKDRRRRVSVNKDGVCYDGHWDLEKQSLVQHTQERCDLCFEGSAAIVPVKSWYAAMMSAAMFPGVPRWGDYELRKAYRDSIS